LDKTSNVLCAVRYSPDSRFFKSPNNYPHNLGIHLNAEHILLDEAILLKGGQQEI